MADVLGAVLPEEQVDWKPVLSGMGMEKIVAVHNPLTNDFRVQYSRSVVAAPGPNPNLAFTREKTGLDLSKANPQKHVSNFITLKAGQTVNLPGDIAQKAVQDLTSYIISVRDKRLIADPHARQETEKELVLTIRDATDFLNQPSVQDFTEKQIEDLNPVAKVEPEKPKIEAPNPPPGQGASFVPTKS